MTALRHGDWMFVPVDESADDAKPAGKTFTFGEGEATGHYHVAVASRAGDMLWSKRGDEFIAKVLAPIHAKHPEHSLKGDLIIPPGTYRVVRRREKDWFAGAVRRVID